ncbi:30S ribosomal protein S11 [Patescibacteria group bacterium]
MGKKRVIKQTEEEALKRTEAQEKADRKVESVKKSNKSIQVGHARVCIQSTYNNTIITITDMKGEVLAWASSGSSGFKGPRKATPFAASRVVELLLEKIKNLKIREIDILVKGVGIGRDSAIRALVNYGLEVNCIKDITPIPHNGCRSPKPRRV